MATTNADHHSSSGAYTGTSAPDPSSTIVSRASLFPPACFFSRKIGGNASPFRRSRLEIRIFEGFAIVDRKNRRSSDSGLSAIVLRPYHSFSLSRLVRRPWRFLSLSFSLVRSIVLPFSLFPTVRPCTSVRVARVCARCVAESVRLRLSSGSFSLDLVGERFRAASSAPSIPLARALSYSAPCSSVASGHTRNTRAALYCAGRAAPRLATLPASSHAWGPGTIAERPFLQRASSSAHRISCSGIAQPHSPLALANRRCNRIRNHAFFQKKQTVGSLVRCLPGSRRTERAIRRRKRAKDKRGTEIGVRGRASDDSLDRASARNLSVATNPLSRSGP